MKKIISLIMVLSILLSIGTISFNAADINKSGDSGSSKVTADIEEARFSVTVPTVLPIAVDADNNVTVADNAVVRNNNNGPVEITDISVKATGGWSLVGFNTDFTKRPVNTKEYGMVINATDTTSDGKILAECFSTIDGGGTHKVDYDGNVAIQSKATKDLHIGNVIFTIGWKTPNISSFNTSNVKNMELMFTNCKKLKRIYVSNYFDVNNVYTDTNMFNGCSLLKGGNGTVYSSNHVDKEYARIDGKDNLPGYFTEKAA